MSFLLALSVGWWASVGHDSVAVPAGAALPGSLARWQRRHLTYVLNLAWGSGSEAPLWSPLAGFGPAPRPSLRRRRHRQLFRRKVVCWTRTVVRSPHWSGRPNCGVRFGEADNPGPVAPGTPLGGERPAPAHRRRPRSPGMDVDADAAAPAARVFCPVPSCPCSDPRKARGWVSEATMLQNHINAHLSGSLEGEVPESWLRERGKTRCLVCGLCVSVQRGVHPTCRPEYRAAADVPAASSDHAGGGGEQLPSLVEVQSARTPTLRHVPAAARHSWCQALTRALAAVAHHNDLRSWVELLMLPQAVLCPPPRRGRKHLKAAAAFTLDRLHRWQQGERAQLWDSRPVPRARRSGAPSAAEKREWATALGREGFDRKACAALLSEGLLPQSHETACALDSLHPAASPPATPSMQELPLAPELADEVVARCLREFPPDTAPGPNRPSRAALARSVCGWER